MLTSRKVTTSTHSRNGTTTSRDSTATSPTTITKASTTPSIIIVIPGTETEVSAASTGTGAPIQITGAAAPGAAKDGLSVLGLVGFVIGGLVL